MVRIARQTDPEKLKALKVKINDQRYLQVAIEGIARSLTNEIVSRTGIKNGSKV